MVRNDDFYLRKWTEYYGRELGESNLYVFLDGKDQPLPDWCPEAHVEAVEKIGTQVVSAEKGRLKFLSEKAAELLKTYDLVIGTDADEFIVVDPKLGQGLSDYLNYNAVDGSMSGLGIDMGQKLGEECDITDDRPFLSQRRYGVLSTRYTKPSILAAPYTWGSGFHRIKKHNFHIAPDLYLFHFGYFDMKKLEERFSDKDRLAQGWGKHMKKRSRTIRTVTELKARKFDFWTRAARRIQTYVRPPYAWNKPAMFNIKLVVQVPLRFRNLV